MIEAGHGNRIIELLHEAAYKFVTHPLLCRKFLVIRNVTSFNKIVVYVSSKHTSQKILYFNMVQNTAEISFPSQIMAKIISTLPKGLACVIHVVASC